MSDVLIMQHVSKRYGGLRVFDDVTLSVGQGERLGVLGPNGAGKSTLFNLLSGLQQPNSGIIIYEDRPLARLKPWHACQAGIGRTFQIPQPFLGMSVLDNVMVGLTNGLRLSIGAARRKAEEALHATGLLRYAGRPAGALTLLNLKRLELARAIAVNPRLLLLDEIAGGLTEAECDELLDILAHVAKPEMTIIWIEHVIHALSAFASRIAVLADRRIITQGGLSEVLAHSEVRSLYFGEG